jgi:single-stranded-DNA-specific exonuclease
VPESAARAKTFVLEPFDYGEARALVDGLGVAEPVAVTLVRRGYRTVAEARAFLEAADDHDPFGFDSMSEVVERIRAAIGAGRRITVHGDYDVDGVCSTAILVHALRELGADCDWLIPGRLDDGYGLTTATVQSLADRGTSLLITVDCGIGSVAEVAAARAAGLEVIVTDHHQPGSELPGCPILHPQLSNYPCAELCATGVAYKLAAALRGRDAVEDELDLVALATVADLVPLRGENRSLVRRGLAVARRARRPGLRALMASAAVAPERLDEGDFAFRLGPRINAAGRLYRADAGVELMLTDDPDRAETIAAELERANGERRGVEREVLAGAERALSELPPELAEAPGVVIAGEGWHPGVVGIVASRLAEQLWRPVVLIGLDGEGRGRGSGRSIPGFDLLDALRACESHLIRYGGHRAAAGLELDAGEVDAFRAAFAAAAAERLAPEALMRTEAIDAVVGGESLGHDVAEQLARLGPFGLGNPGIRLLLPAAKVSDVRPMGETERHARFSVQCGPRRALGVAFGVNGELEAAAAAPCDLSVTLELNEWNGAVEPRVVLGEIYEAGEGATQPSDDLAAVEFWGRFDSELARDLSAWPPPDRNAAGSTRDRIERRKASAVAAIAALASTGASVLVLCADAPRRREVVERAARPARFGGGSVAVVSGRFADETVDAARAKILDPGSGVLLADWPALERRPGLPDGFSHVLVIDPAPFAHLDRLAAAGEGYLHDLCGPAEAEFALRVLADEWPSRASLGELYRALRAGCAAGRLVAGDDRAVLAADEARTTLAGAERRHPRSPEACGRLGRILGELGLIRWQGSDTARTLGVVSSEATDLNRSAAFVAYRDRYEEGRRFLNRRRQN